MNPIQKAIPPYLMCEECGTKYSINDVKTVLYGEHDNPYDAYIIPEEADAKECCKGTPLLEVRK